MTLTFETNLAEFNAALTQYARLSSKGAAEAVAKKGADFGWRLSRKLLTLAPGKGVVRTERLAALKSGGGVKVRDKVLQSVMKSKGASQDILTRGYRMGKNARASVVRRGKRMNFWAIAVQRELNLRESGRGFSALSARYKSLSQQLAADRFGQQRRQIVDRYNRFLSYVGFRRSSNETSLLFSWGGNESSNKLAVSLQKPKQQRAIASALDESRQDMIDYILRKQAQAAQALAR